MKASKMIEELSKLIETHGDIEVNRHNQDSTFRSFPVTVKEIEALSIEVDLFSDYHYIEGELLFEEKKVILIK